MKMILFRNFQFFPCFCRTFLFLLFFLSLLPYSNYFSSMGPPHRDKDCGTFGISHRYIHTRIERYSVRVKSGQIVIFDSVISFYCFVSRFSFNCCEPTFQNAFSLLVWFSSFFFRYFYFFCLLFEPFSKRRSKKKTLHTNSKAKIMTHLIALHPCHNVMLHIVVSSFYYGILNYSCCNSLFLFTLSLFISSSPSFFPSHFFHTNL